MVAFLLATAGLSEADDATASVVDAGGFSPNRNYFSQLPYEHIDPLTGNLLLTFTDLMLPGNAGFDLRIQRTYNSKIYWDYQFHGAVLGEDSWAGVGWSVHMGRVFHASTADGSAPIIEMPDGSRHQTYHHISPPAGCGNCYVTRDFWVYDKNTSTLKLTNGIVYTFGHDANIAGYNGAARYATNIQDPYGNSIVIAYMTGTGVPADGIASITQDLGGGQTRQVTFTSTLDTYRSIDTMTFAGRTWRYTSAPTAEVAHSLLTQVTPPVGPSWQYQYNTGTNLKYELIQVTTPNGGQINYTYALTNFNIGSTISATSPTVIQRVTSGPSGGTWNYAYAQGADRNQTVITSPCGTTTYTFLGVGTNPNVAGVWKIGVPSSKVLSDASGVLESESFSWVNSSAISNDQETIGFNHDPAIYVPLMTGRTVTRAGQSYQTSYGYGGSNFNDYGRANSILEQGQLGRTTGRTFQYGFTPYIVDKLASETVTVGAESFTRSYGYDASTGFLSGETIYGIPTYYGADARGNRQSVRDANGNTTSFTHSWGVVKDTTTPEYIIGRTINADGTVASETRRGFTTTFQYDALSRPTVKAPPLGNPWVTTYDNIGGATVTVTRGPSRLTTSIDGFGRSIATSNSVLVNTAISYDACGRRTYESYPYTTSNIGTAFQYDNLNRTTLKTNTGDSTTVGYVYSGINVDTRDENSHHTYQTWQGFGDPRDAWLMSVRDANGQTTSYSYNALGSLKSVAIPGFNTRQWVYNSRNQVVSETHPENGTVSYTYYAAGNVATRTDAAFGQTSFGYDHNTRLTSIDRPGTAYDTTIGYDASDNRTSLINSYVSGSFAYDAANRLTSRTDIANGKTFTTGYAYDNNDNVLTLTYPSQRRVVYTYDSESRILTVKDGSNSPYATGFGYHPSGAVASFTAGNSLAQSFSYDPRYRPSVVNTGAPLILTYGYDNVGNVATINESSRTGMNQSFGYDALDRVTTATGFWGSGSFNYDGPGNRQYKSVGGTTSYVYNASNRLTSSSGAENDSFQYDGNGNTTSNAAGANTYSYTPTNMLDTATVGGAGTTYRYDGDDMRTVKVDGTTTRFFLHGPGSQILSEMSLCSGGQPMPARDYIYSGNRLVAGLQWATVTVEMESASTEVCEGVGQVGVRVRAVTSDGGQLPQNVTVQYATADGSAVGGGPNPDYTPTSGTLTFAQGSLSGTTQTIPITIINDGIAEQDETFSVNLSNPSCPTSLGQSTYVVTIHDDEPTVAFQASTSSVAENITGGQWPIPVQLTTAANCPQTSMNVTVNYATIPGGTATSSGPHADYTLVPGTLTFASGSGSGTIKTIPAQIINDNVDEPDETFLVQLSGVTNATLGTPDLHTATILDDDPQPNVSINDVSVTEGDSGTTGATFTISLDRPSEFPDVSVNYATADGTALAPGDYASRSGTLSFPPYATSLALTVPVVGDKIWEAPPPETFFVNLSSPSHCGIGDGQGVGTIVDNDPAGLSVNDVSVIEGLGAAFTVTLAPPLPSPVTVDYQTVAGTAVPVQGVPGVGDYYPISGTLTFPAGKTQQEVTVLTSPWGGPEGVETFTLHLPSASGAAIAYADGLARIVEPPSGSDLSGDLKTDIVFRHAVSGKNVVWFMDGMTQTAGVFTNPDTLPDTNWQIEGTGDFDGDGKSDLLFRHAVSGKNVVWIMDGITRTAGVYTNPDSLPDTNWQIAGTGDFSTPIDGKPDILWRHAISGKNVVWYMDGITRTAGVFTNPDSLPDTDWQIAGTGDFDTNGKTDILWRHAVSGKITVWYMDGITRTGAGFASPDVLADIRWQIVSTRDYNVDGRPDILFRHAASGKNVVWYMDGITQTMGVFTNPDTLADTNWQIVGPR